MTLMNNAHSPPGSYQRGAARVVIDNSSGLPSNQVHKITTDRIGRLWLAGPSGLSRFDGSTVQSYDRRHGLKCNGLRSVGVGSDETLWVGTDLGLEAFGPDTRPMPWADRFAWPFGLCEHIDAAGGFVWVGTAQGLVRLDPGGVKASPQVAIHAEVGFVLHVARVSDSQAYAASATLGLVECFGGSWNKVRCQGLSASDVTRVLAGPGDSLAVGTSDGMFILNATTKEVVARLRSPDDTGPVTALARGANEWWVAFRDTLVALPFEDPTGGVSEVYRMGCFINDLVVDAVGNVWVATDTSGLAQVSCLRHALRQLDLGNDGSVFTIKPGPADTYMIGGDKLGGTVSLAGDASGGTLAGPGGLPATTVWDVHSDASGLWAATHLGLYRAAPGAEFVRAFADHPVLGAPARVLLSRAGDLWVGTLRGLARIRSGRQEEILLGDGKPLGYVYALHVDPDGRLWVATLGRGLWREDGGRLELVAGEPLSATGNTYAVATGPGGETLVIQDEKVVLLDRSLATRLVEEHHPVAGWTALWLAPDTVAVGSSEGLRVLNVVTGLVTTRVQALFGARAWEFTNNRTLVRDGRGRLLCGVNGGLLRVDLDGLRHLTTPPAARLLEVEWHGTQPEQVGDTVRVRPGKWSVRIRAFAAWFVDHEQVAYRYKLIGFDDEWSPPYRTPEVVYTSLPTGRYEVVCQAHSPLTGFGPPVTLYKLSVGRPWWAMGWAAALGALETVYDRVVRSRSRNRLLLERNAALGAEVAERTAELRTVNAQLARANEDLQRLSTTDPLTRLRNRRFFDDALAIESKRSTREKTPLSVLLVDADHFKSINDTYGHPFGDECLIAIGRALGTVVQRPTDVAARYGGEEFIVLLPGTPKDAAHILGERIRTAVEALELKSGGSPVRLTVSVGVGATDPRSATTQASIVQAADDALYRAKKNGRNRVEG